MKSMIIVTLALVAVTVALPIEEAEEISQQTFEQDPNGGYNFTYDTSKGSSRKEQGSLKEVFDEDKVAHTVVVVRGAFSYINPEGELVEINYIADETGYHADGPSVPKVPARR